MNKKVFFTGDTHGDVSHRVDQFLNVYKDIVPEETMLIVLGDVGLNYYMNKKDQRNKREVEDKGVYVYCVRGNHEARPSDVPGMKLVHDETVSGAVWMEEEFPHIRYFCDWGIYEINGLRTLVIGGAYSVDKHYRLARGFRWFENEQLKDHEMRACEYSTEGRRFDLVLTHTCPFSWRPTDLFLGCIDQSTVDNTMEIWMERLKDKIEWGAWLFGHYHNDRIERPHVEMFYWEIESLEDIVERWARFDKTGELDWWLPKGPGFYMEVPKRES
jgi:3-oxoacid CoA-transferase subunit A